ncbi:MAG: aminomethyltransferase family protein, partial [Pseudomonadota bacterium]
YLITAATAQLHDRDWLIDHLPVGSPITIEDLTETMSTLIVTGPTSRDVLGGLCGADLAQPWLSHQESEIAGQWVRLLRVSFAGELGWEVHALTDGMPKVYEAVLGAGAKPFGMFALDSLRMEKGYRTWKGDLSTDYTLFQAGLGRFVRLNKAQDFPGKTALMNEQQQGSTRAFATMVLQANGHDAPYMSNVWKGDEHVGETTSGGWGYRVDASIALGIVRPDCAEPGTELEVEIFGERVKAVVQHDQPLWDPENQRLRA